MGGCMGRKGRAIGEAWDAGCIMAVGKVDPRNAHNPEQL